MTEQAPPEKFKIRRSDGSSQWVTKEELDNLNHQRKVRDQQRQARRTHSVRNMWSIAIGVIVVIAVAVFVIL